MSYTSKTKIENYLMTDIDSSFDTQVTEWIASVEKYIDNYTGKTFEEGDSEVKYYDGTGETEIAIDDAVEITEVLLLDVNGDVEETLTEGDGNDYLLYPLNDTPKTSIVLTAVATIANFSTGRKRVKVTGKFGNSTTVPVDIELIATKLVSAIIQKGLRGGEIKQESLGDYSVTFVAEVAEELKVEDVLEKYVVFKV